MYYQRKKDVVVRSVAGENVLIPVQGCTSSVYTLNNTGCFLWELLAQARSEGHLADALVARYSITQDAAQQDVKTFLNDLIRMELVVLVTDKI